MKTTGTSFIEEHVEYKRLPEIVVASLDNPEVNQVVDEIRLFGMLDRSLSEMKYILDHPQQFDAATFQTLKHHIEDADLFVKYAIAKLEKIKSLPPTAEQRPRGY